MGIGQAFGHPDWRAGVSRQVGCGGEQRQGFGAVGTLPDPPPAAGFSTALNGLTISREVERGDVLDHLNLLVRLQGCPGCVDPLDVTRQVVLPGFARLAEHVGPQEDALRRQMTTAELEKPQLLRNVQMLQGEAGMEQVNPLGLGLCF